MIVPQRRRRPMGCSLLGGGQSRTANQRLVNVARLVGEQPLGCDLDHGCGPGWVFVVAVGPAGCKLFRDWVEDRAAFGCQQLVVASIAFADNNREVGDMAQVPQPLSSDRGKPEAGI